MTAARLGLLLLVTVAVAAAPAAAAPGHLEGYVPAIASTSGVNQSFWSTDLWIYQQGASVIHLWFNRQGRDNAETESVVVDLDSPVTHLTDVVRTVFASEGVGSLHYLADGPVVVTSRTWTPDEGGGEYGQSIPGIPLDRATVAGAGQAGALRMVADHRPTTRSNLGLVNVSAVATSLEVALFRADGIAAADPFTVELPPFGMTQLGDVLARLGESPRPGIVIRVAVASAAGAAMAYLSTVDNATNDPSYQEAFRFSR